ncbi:MAG: iron-containing alcohol dehydrogenase [Kiritimatiellae bacterium]|nr:iron-containing alcohol dehydrogenase [Kiritimatiellia bacterium]
MLTIPKEIALPARVLFARGAAADLLPGCATLGGRGILLHGRSLRRSGALSRILAGRPAGLEVEAVEHTGGEPTLAQVAALRAKARAVGAAWVAGVGGGSVMDLAKAAAGLMHAEREPAYYHGGGALRAPGVPFVAAPTTAGSGAEATVNAVLTNAESGVKKSIRDPSFMARLVVLDPALLEQAPPRVTAESGMDAFTQALESFWSAKASWLSDQLALKGLCLIARHLQDVFEARNGIAADNLLLGSFLTGVAFSASRLGVVHGLAHPLGSIYGVPHGRVCAACLPHAVAFNREAVGAKYGVVCDALGEDLPAWIERHQTRFGLDSPFAGQPIRDRARIVREVLASGSTAANPRPVTERDVDALLQPLFAQG